MKCKQSRKTLSPCSLSGERRQSHQNRMRQEGLEHLIAVLEIAIAHNGRVYRPSTRVTPRRWNQLSRLRAAHAAYALASGLAQFKIEDEKGDRRVTV